MRPWPVPGLGHEMEHGVLGVEYLFPGEVFIAPDILGRLLRQQRADGEGAVQLGEAKCVMAYRFVAVRCGLPAPPDGEVVELDVLQEVQFVKGVDRRSSLDPVANLTVWVEGIYLGLLSLDFLALLLGFPFLLGTPCVLSLFS